MPAVATEGGYWLFTQRRLADLEQEELATKLSEMSSNVGQTDISKWERGHRAIPPKHVPALVQILGDDPSEVFELTAMVQRDAEVIRRLSGRSSWFLQTLSDLLLRIFPPAPTLQTAP